MFLDTGQTFSGLTLNSEYGIMDSCPSCGWPHTAHPIAKISKVQQRSRTDFIDQCIQPIKSLSSVKKSILSNCFATLLLTQPFNW